PFVVVLATPKFCTSRTCGPVVDVVDAVRRRFSRTDVRFIHVEVYRRNEPTLGLNRFMREWHLPSEPWVFLVGADGRIEAKFEELEPVVRRAFGDVFVSIDPEPIATASIAQIHPALLRTGQEVVVKVRRPGVVEQVELDLEVLRSTAKLLERRSESAQLLQLE